MIGSEPKSRFSLAGRARSFTYAFRGIGVMLVSQHNAWIHALATMAVIVAGFVFRLGRAEWCWITLSLMAVWTAETLNTAFEFLADVAHPDFHPLVRRAKDVAAGAVLISAIGAVAIAVLVFGPHVARVIAPEPAPRPPQARPVAGHACLPSRIAVPWRQGLVAKGCAGRAFRPSREDQDG